MKTNRLLQRTALLLLFLYTLAFVSPALAQDPGSFQADKDRAVQLVNQKKFAEALPLLEKLAASDRADGEVFLGLGIAKWQLQDPKDKAKWRELRLGAKKAFLRAKSLGVSLPEVDLIVASINDNGGDKGESSNPQAQAAMDEAFPFFASGDYEKAVAAYEKAANLDPTHYEAALYTGNTYYALKKYEIAGNWFAKAIAIDRDRETAHRYWADALWKSGKDREAVDKFLDAIVGEPYSSAAWRGIQQYARSKNVTLAHPKIDVPVGLTSSEGKTNITLGNILGGKDDDGSFAWMAYGISRAAWQTGKGEKLSEDFAKAHPGEKVYRHSLAEEAAAFRMVIGLLKDEKKVKNPQPSLAALRRLEQEGLLESWILLTRASEGMRADYAVYRNANRDKIKRYLSDYVMKNGGV